MREFEKYFVISSFEEGWGIDEYVYEELLYDYCTEVLFIPHEKIEELSISSEGLEILLSDLHFEDISEDWYIHLMKMGRESIVNKYIA